MSGTADGQYRAPGAERNNRTAMSEAQRQNSNSQRDLLGHRSSPQFPRPGDGRIAPRRQAPSPLQLSETSAMMAEKNMQGGPNPRSPTIMRAASGSQYSPRSSRFNQVADQDQPRSPRERLDELLATENSTAAENINHPNENGAFWGPTPTTPKANSYNQLRNVSSPFPQAKPTTASSPQSPPLTASPPSKPSNTRPEQQQMPRTSSIDSAISTISIATSHSHQSSQDSLTSHNAEISSLINTAGSAEALIQHLLKERQHSAAQNTQLWTLVDKQRALLLGLNQDLERALKDKERYRKKLKEHMAQIPPVPNATAQAPRNTPRPASESPAPSESQDELPIQGSTIRDPRSHTLGEPAVSLENDVDVYHSNVLGMPPEAPEGSPAVSDNGINGIKHQSPNLSAEDVREPSSRNNNDGPAAAKPKHSVAPIITTDLSGPGQIAHPNELSRISQTSNTVVSPSSFTAKRSQPLVQKPSEGPSLELSEPTPPDKLFERTLPPSRKLPPAPLNLHPPKRETAQPPELGPTDHSESEYDDDLEADEIPAFERGRKKTRAEDDKEREVAILKEQEGRSRSSKKSKGSKPPVENAARKAAKVNAPQQMPMPSTIKGLLPEPTSPGASSYLSAPASLASVLNPPSDQHESNKTTHGMQTRSLSPNLPLSPGLPLSPRPGDRPMNPPTPRLPRDTGGNPMASPPLSPRGGFVGLPLSPRAPRQTIPFPPNTPMSISSPIPLAVDPRMEPVETIQKPLSPIKGLAQPPDSIHESEPGSPRAQILELPRSRGVYRGFISDERPDLLIPPNALPSIIIRVISSRLKPSRHSYLALKGSEEEPVFTLGVSARSDRQELWQVEKPLLSLPTLDKQLQSSNSGAKLPERSLFSGHAPAKIDARRVALERYFETVLDAPMDEKAALALCQYLSTHVLEPSSDEASGNITVSQAGSPVTLGPSGRPMKEGYLTKRGKNFGGWKARFFVLDEPILRYYESPGGSLLGTIKLQHAQIGKQSAQHPPHSPSRGGEDSDNQYRHAFLILEPKRKDSSSLVRHVLCAESDAERDVWVETLLYYVESSQVVERPRPAPSSNDSGSSRVLKKQQPGKRDAVNTDSPDSETFDGLQAVSYENTIAAQAPLVQIIPDQRTTDSPSPPVPATQPAGRSPGSQTSKTISGPSNGTKIQDERAWGNKPKPTLQTKDKEHKKRSIWGFRDRNQADLATHHSNGSSISLTQQQYQEQLANVRPAFGAPLAQAVEFCPPHGIHVGLPAVVYRCLEYLEAKDAASEEGIFRLSGSSVVIKGLKDRFNTEGDFDFLADEQFYDVHAVASLLKLYLRELPTTVLTRELHINFIEVLGGSLSSLCSALFIIVNTTQMFKRSQTRSPLTTCLCTSFPKRIGS